MQKRNALLILILFFINIAYAAEIDSSVEEELNDKASVSVIVVLEDAESSKAKGISSIFEQRKSKIKEQQEKVLGSLEVKSFEQQAKKEVKSLNSEEYDIMLKHKYSTINSFSGEITQKGLEKLRKNPNVKSVIINGRKELFLDVSVPMINASSTWGYVYNNTNITGKGETVCVIDSGVDYTHPNLGDCSRTTNINDGSCDKIIGGYDYVNNDNDPFDGQGHGTHIAGIIISNHTNYTGVAPDTKLVAIKACTDDANSICMDNDIIASIDWCVNNALTYNISVITMSLGGGLFDSYCDNVSLESNFKTAINIAVLNNITVTVATGNNNGGEELISSPACIQNATAIGAVNDIDVIQFNRNSITDLLAPGKFIYSTYLTNTFNEQSGTSMAAPHAAGAFALLNQFYKNQFEQTPVPSVLEDALNDTGKNIIDGANTYQRINIYAALLSLDTISPVLNMTYPLNNSKVRNTWLVINVTSNEILKSAQLEWDGTTNYTMDGSSLSFYYNITNQNNTDYTFRIYGNDSSDNIGITNVFTIELNNTAPSIASYYPSNLTQNISEPSNQKFNISFLDAENDLINISWYKNSSLVLSGINQTEWNFIGNYSSDGDYNISVILNDGAIGGAEISMSWILKINNTNRAPNITLNSPSNNSYFGYNWNLFNLSVVDDDNDTMNCYLYADNFSDPVTLINITANLVSGSVLIYNWTGLSETIYYWKMQCDDYSMNSSNTTTQQFTIDLSSPSTYASISASNVSDSDSDGNIELNWTDDSSEDNETYRLYRHNAEINSSNIGSAAVVANGIKEGVQFYEDNTTQHGTTYWYVLVTVDRVGNYNTSVISNSYNATANDTIYPKSLTNLNVTQSGNTATVQWKNITQDVEENADFFNARYIVYTSTSINASRNIINVSEFTKVGNITGNRTTYSIGASGIRYFVVVAADDAGNENLSLDMSSEGNYVNISLTYTAPIVSGSSGGGGGGGSGGGGKIVQSKGTSASRMWSEAEGETLMPIRNSDIAVSELKIDIINPSENVEVTVTKLDEKPDVMEIVGKVYQYIEIDKKNIENSDIGSAEITFRVEQSWLEENNANAEDIVLSRYTSKWKKLPTELVKQDGIYAHYKATTPGFSYFAISFEEKVVILDKKDEVNQSLDDGEDDNSGMSLTSGAVTATEIEPKKGFTLNRVIAVVAFIGLVYVVIQGVSYIRRRNKNKP